MPAQAEAAYLPLDWPDGILGVGILKVPETALKVVPAGWGHVLSRV